MRKLLLGSLTAFFVYAASVLPSSAAGHDCAFFSRGLGGIAFSYALDARRIDFIRHNPRARVEVHEFFTPVDARGCKNPLFVGHSLGAIRAVQNGNAAGRGRVISIDAPDWYTRANGLRSSRPTVNFYHCPPSPYGCGRVTGPNVRNVEIKVGHHVGLPLSPVIQKEVLR